MWNNGGGRTMGRKRSRLIDENKKNKDGKFHVLPQGDLLVFNVDFSDHFHTFRCRTIHRLTRQVVVSSPATIQVTVTLVDPSTSFLIACPNHFHLPALILAVSSFTFSIVTQYKSIFYGGPEGTRGQKEGFVDGDVKGEKGS
ncbi:hypothetical protein J437_LFUL009997 [Ladona fulva]|uniref:Uncharacterized protein n=1 Tax=Ladona fulva TaxID=123851 RepID=A0A8K0P1H0_LADFU|nr:hypothetical protein J437_LFUL009997 [Ladona fulva]